MKIGNSATPIQVIRKIGAEIEAKMLLDPNYDPLAKKEIAKSPTINDAFAKYKNQLSLNKRKTTTEIIRQYEKDIAPSFGEMKVKEISRGIIKEWFDNLSMRSKYTANSCLRILKTTLEIAIDYEYLESNPANRIKKHPEVKRERFYTQEEKISIFQELFKRLDEDKSLLHSVSFILLLIFTGARKGELAKATWSDYKGDYLEIKEHKTDDKTNKPRKIWLNAQSRAVIQTLQGEKKKKTIFGIKNPKRLWNSVKLACKCNDLRMHDLRHSFGTISANSAKIQTLETGELMGHKSLDIMKRYQHIEDRTSKVNIEKIGEEILDGVNFPITYQ